MIVTKLIGGLGNQMFQYAAAKALAVQHKTTLKVDTSFLDGDDGTLHTKRAFELDIFEMPVEKIPVTELRSFLYGFRGGINKLLNFLFRSRLAKHYFVEKGPYYHEDIKECDKDVYLSGFWQNENYFADCADVIRNDFKIRKEYLKGTSEWLQLISDNESVSLHIRRGDYISNKNASTFHGVCSVEYYNKAVALLSDKYTDLTLFVFSDDISWCKENLKFEQTCYFVENGNTTTDFFLMQNCKHNVIANSSYSWWAAWLNRNENKQVIAPEKWFNDPQMSNNSIVPAKWLKL